MKHRCAVLLALLAMGAGALAEDEFARANRDYAEGKFAEAKRGFEQVLARNATANGWYNLGNACFRLGEIGRAALAYERAVALAPNHADAIGNLRMVRQKSGARILDPGWSARVFGSLPATVAPWLAVALAWAGLAWAGAALWRRSGSAGVICGSLLALLAAGYGGGVAWWRSLQADLAIIVVERAEAHAEPADSAARHEALPSGSRVRLISSLGKWNYCELPTKARGWIEAKQFERIGIEVRP